MKSFLRIVGLQLIFFGYCIFFAAVMLIAVLTLQKLGYGYYTKHLIVMGISLICAITILLFLKFYTGERIKIKSGLLLGLALFLIGIPIALFVVSLRNIDPNAGKIINIEMIRNAPLR